MRDALRTQMDAWSRLKRDAAAIATRAAEGRAALAQIPAISPQMFPGYEAHVAALAAQMQSLSRGLAQVSAGFAPDEHNAWDQLVGETEEVVLNRLRRALLSYPELARALARVEQAFRVEREIKPHVRTVQLRFDELGAELQQQRFFHARAALDALRGEAQVARERIAASGVDGEYTTPATAAVQQMLSAGERLYHDATRSFTPQMMVSTHFRKEVTRLAGQCRDVTERKAVRCGLLRTLVLIPPDEILRMTEPQLEYLEHTIERVNDGPLATQHD
ncbi:hypothetical protein [Sorangium sp. So ce1389]|uniref:hypothetical protein n=1 Tax=Sorangium sp. So ce1389 TaxID=3133336 RepID=UPI003F5D5AA1